jgi:hypothetical protein
MRLKLICILFFLTNYLFFVRSQEEISNHFFKLEIEEYDHPVGDTLSGFGWFYEYKGNLASLIQSFLYVSSGRVKIINDPKKFIHAKCHNGVDGLSHVKLTLDVLKAKYHFTVKDIYDSVDIIQMSIIDESILVKKEVKRPFPMEYLIKEEREIQEESHIIAINGIKKEPKTEKLTAEDSVIIERRKDSINIWHEEFCKLINQMEDHSNFIFQCKMDENYDKDNIQIGSNGSYYAKYTYGIKMKKSLLNDFEGLKKYLEEKGIRLEKHRQLEQMKLIEFEPPLKD